MATLSIKHVIFFYISMVLTASSMGQNAPFRLLSDLKEKCFFPGDTISFEIKNVSSIGRGYTVEAICIDADASISGLYGDIFTAYLNRDTGFFVRLRDGVSVSRQKKIAYLIPKVDIITHDIEANGTSTFRFVIQGKRLQKGIMLKIRLNPDLVDGFPDSFLETKTFLVFVDVYDLEL